MKAINLEFSNFFYLGYFVFSEAFPARRAGEQRALRLPGNPASVLGIRQRTLRPLRRLPDRLLCLVLGQVLGG